jgi:excisionase family DNA binding protein
MVPRMSNLIPVSQAAEQLGVSRAQVHRLIQSGELRASRLGHAWLIDAASLQRRQEIRPLRGRPLSPAAAWAAVLAEAEHPSVDLRRLAVTARRRARLVHGRVLPVDMSRIVDDARVVVSGSAGAEAQGALVPRRDRVDLYVRDGDWVDLQEMFHVRVAEQDANLLVRVVDDAVWPFDHVRVAPLVVCALDAFEGLDSRSAHEALAAQSAR